MNVRLAILFAAVAEERSFTRAAARLNIAQPWLSAQIRKFEEQLGFPLFDRGKSGIELTPQAEQLLPLALELSDTARRMRELSRALGQDVSLSLRVGAHTASLGVPEFARLNDEFNVKYRDTSLIIEIGHTPELVEQVTGGDLDAALVIAPVEQPELEEIVLRVVAPYVLTPCGLAPADRRALSPADLAGTTLALMRRAEQPRLYDALSRRLEAAGVELRPVPEPSGPAMEHFATTQGIGVLMVEGDPADFATHPTLTARPLDGVDPARHVLIRRRDNEKRAMGRYWRAAAELGLPAI